MTTTLARVLVRGSELERTSARLRLEATLGGCDLRPPGLAPAALLFVRRLSAPPGIALPLDGGGVRPPPEWETALVGALEQALRSAARPALGAVPAAASAVLFADRAELLACLARDALDGTVWGRWWWRSVLAAAGARDPVQTAWLADPVHVPAALELLAGQGLATEVVVRRLPEPPAEDIADAVLRAFDIPVSGPVPARGAAPAGPLATRAKAWRQEPPWRELVPEAAAPRLAPEQRHLLGVALTLRRAPALARSVGFARAARAWRAAAGALHDEDKRRDASPPAPAVERPQEPVVAPRDVVAPTPPNAPLSSPSRLPSPPRTRLHRGEARAPAAPGRADPHALATRALPNAPAAASPPARAAAVGETPLPAAEPPEAAAAPAARRSPLPEPPSGSPAARAAEALPAPALDSPPPVAPRAGRPPVAPARYPAPAPVVDPVTEPPTRPVETRLGGVFYLLNLALFLDLYGDFTRPLDRGLPLDPWDLVALLGTALLGERPPDPVWHVLAGLAGRDPAEPPGRGFGAREAWRVPSAWLEPFEPGGTWRWSAARGVLRVEHPAGFPAVAVPRSGAPPAPQLRRELARLGCPAPLLRTALPREPSGRLERWVARLAAYCDARLRRALGAGDAAATLLRRPARVFVTPAQVDIVFPLAEHPIEVRLAGLDRTPGFIPATGRVVRLHYE
jgi:hypothetical protein